MDSFDLNIEYDANEGEVYISTTNSSVARYTNIRDIASLTEAITTCIENFFNDEDNNEGDDNI